MTRLRLRLDQPGLLDSLRAGAVASVRWLADADGNPVKDWWQQQQPVDLVPTGMDESAFTTFDLPGAGYFSIDVSVPRGDTISKEVRIAAGETARETLTLQVSPHEDLGWQQFAQSICPPTVLPRTADQLAERMSAESYATVGTGNHSPRRRNGPFPECWKR